VPMKGADATIRVFAGPSRPTPLEIPNINWAPPASAGDLRASAHEGFRTLVLADTLFLDAPPSHREILEVIDDGVEVVGCASAGALRAVELEAYGMTGAGVVFHLYRDGSLAEDVEIGCMLDADYRAVAPPLLELRMIFGRLTMRMGDHRLLRTTFQEIADLYFLRRDRAAVRRIVAKRLNGVACRCFEDYLNDPVFAIKARDLEHVARAVASSGKASLSADPLTKEQRTWLARGLKL
jgi:hypothetical protein